MAPAGKITFRTATARDIPVIQELSSRIWREHYPGIITHAQIDYMLQSMYAAEVIHDEIEKQGYVYVLVMDQRDPAGFIAYVQEHAKEAVKISKLYLLPALHGRGIGRQMLDHVRENAVQVGARTIYLFVNKHNAKALQAYERFGFTRAAEVVTDIGGGFVMDDYRMEMPLQGIGG